ncbi:A24 family peptidase [Paenibacillus sp. M1]|uniref:A24 family peptidase n=1 Tax=Paenibacillus haidiansis TaxID=1574488 RepID=A0ABU7VRJ0_9BACL
MTAALFASLHLRFGFSGAWAVGVLLSALCVLITITDLASRVIPNGALLAFGILLLAAVPFAGARPLWLHLLGAAAGSGILLLLAVLTSGRGMGMGDVKLLAVLGWTLGFPEVLFALFFGSVAGLSGGLLLKAAGGKGRGQRIAFGPFLSFGAIIVYVYGKEIIDWYLSNLIHP